jgi:Got1/Sft2-like family
MSKANNFSSWVDQQRNAELVVDEEEGGSPSSSFMGQLSAIQDSFTNQLSELSGSLADAPLSAAFRARVTHAIYLLGISVIFGLLAIFIGLPTLILRPAKFVICITLCTLSAAGSVIILQKPAVFFGGLVKNGIMNALPVILLFTSMIFTIYCTVFIHKYLVILFAGGVQLLCMAFYLASFIPGGSRGLIVLLKMGYAVLSTAMKPCVFVIKKSMASLLRTVMS